MTSKDNPILVDFRRFGGNAAEWAIASEGWWRTTAGLAGANRRQLEHARRVLSKLAAL